MPVEVTCSGTTGPYRRVFSKPGYSYVSAIVHLPGRPDVGELDASNNVKPTGDTAFIYLGGWGSSGGAVDAGFQHSPTLDNWALFLTCEGCGYISDSGSRFASNQDVFIEFFIPNDNHLVVHAKGTDINGNAIDRELDMDVAAFPDTNVTRAGQATNFQWLGNGGQNVLKRMTSIAQSNQTWNTGSFIRNVQWSQVLIGTNPGNAAVWDANITQGYHNWQDETVVVVNFVSPSEETVAIDL